MKIEMLGRYSLDEVIRRGLFLSYLVCRDDRNCLVIVGSNTPYLMNYDRSYLQVQKVSKVNMGKAIMKAQMRGRMMPGKRDLEDSRTVRLRVEDVKGRQLNQVMNVYRLTNY